MEGLDQHLEGSEVGLDVGLLLVGQTEVVVVARHQVVVETVGEQDDGVHGLLHHHDLGVDGQLTYTCNVSPAISVFRKSLKTYFY